MAGLIARAAAGVIDVAMQTLFPSDAERRARVSADCAAPAASVTAAGSAEVSTGHHPVPSAEHPGLEWLGHQDRDALWVLSEPGFSTPPTVYGWRDGAWRWTKTGAAWQKSCYQRGLILCAPAGAHWLQFHSTLPASAGPPAAVDDPAGSSPLPAGSPDSVPAAVSACTDVAALPAGVDHTPAELIIALCRQVQLYQAGVPMTAQRHAYLDELLDESTLCSTDLTEKADRVRRALRGVRPDRIENNVRAAAETFPQSQR